MLPRGFTDHEHLDSVSLIHMNGRVYDPALGRYLSAYPIVQDPEDSQSLNRYSYVLNNPMSLTDPSGLFSIPIISDVIDEVAGFVGDAFEYVIDNPQVIVAIGVGVVTGFAGAGVLGPALGLGATGSAVLGGAIGGFSTGLIASGGDLDAALIGGFTGAAFGFIGGSRFFGPIGRAGAPRVIAHGVVGGTSAEFQGGMFSSGFISAAFAKAATGPIDAEFGATNPAAGAVDTAVVGGTISRITGGKFANGAVTAAFGYLFNNALSRQYTGNPDEPLESNTVGPFETVAGVALFPFRLAAALARGFAIGARGLFAARGTIIRGREFSTHALDQMVERGVPPSAVEGAIQNGIKVLDRIPGRVQYNVSGGGRGAINLGQPTGQQGLTVIVDDNTARVVTVIKRGSDYIAPSR